MTRHKVYLLILILLHFTASCFAQQLHRYEGKLKLNNELDGDESYRFYIQQRDTIRHGNYEFEHTQRIKENDTTAYKAINLSGKYTRGFKHGAWTFSQKKLRPRSQGTIQDYVVMYTTSGEELLVNALFQKGRAHGQWNCYRWKINDSQPIDTLYHSTARFENAQLTGIFTARATAINVIGNINKRGEPDGQWVFHHTAKDSLKEYRLYQAGALINHYLIQGSDTVDLYSTKQNSPATEEIEVMEIGQAYFNIQQQNYYGFLADTLKNILVASDHFWQQALNIYTGQDYAVWSATPGAEKIKLAKVKVRKFPFSAKELALKEELQEISKAVRIKINTLLRDPQIAVARYSSPQIGLHYQVLKQFNDAISLTDSILAYFSVPEFEYINRPKIFAAAFETFSYQPNIQYFIKGNKITQTYNFIQINTEVRPYLPELISHLQWISTKVDTIQQETDHSLEQIRLQNILVKQETEMMKKYETVKALFDNSSTEHQLPYFEITPTKEKHQYNQFHAMAKPHVDAFVDTKINEYANLSSDEKIIMGKALLSCFQHLENMYTQLAQLPALQATINKAYTRTVFNPYTYTYLDERIKDRIYTAYDKKIFPFLTLQLQRSLDCDNIVPLINNYKILYEAMLSYLGNNTSRLERRIHKNDSPEKLIKKLDLDLYY